MHTLKLKIEDSVFDKIYYFLSNLPKNEVEIVENKIVAGSTSSEMLETQSFSNHSADLIEEWKNDTEDDVWK